LRNRPINRPDPQAIGRRATSRLMEAILIALEESRPRGYVSSAYLAGRIGWGPEDMPSPNRQGYGHIAITGLLYRLYLADRVEPAHHQNRRGHWGGWRISDSEYAKRHGLDVSEVVPPPSLRLAATTISGEVPLSQYPMPPIRGAMPAIPQAIRYPDGRELRIGEWEDILVLTVQWLNERGILTPERVPVPMSRGLGYLVNVDPVHSDGRPMAKRTQAQGPDRFWVHTKTSASPGYYAVYHAQRLLELFRQDPARTTLMLSDDESSTP